MFLESFCEGDEDVCEDPSLPFLLQKFKFLSWPYKFSLSIYSAPLVAEF